MVSGSFPFPAANAAPVLLIFMHTPVPSDDINGLFHAHHQARSCMLESIHSWVSAAILHLSKTSILFIAYPWVSTAIPHLST
eukprot:1143786-Pelagomonas_calceolata.AAC.1